jgi:nitric oxide dioxygenase
VDFDAVGRINAELLCAHLPSDDAEFYFSGPSGFMAATEHILDELGVAAERRHTEAFGPTATFSVKSAEP